jgi:hypothetical protein
VTVKFSTSTPDEKLGPAGFAPDLAVPRFSTRNFQLSGGVVDVGGGRRGVAGHAYRLTGRDEQSKKERRSVSEEGGRMIFLEHTRHLPLKSGLPAADERFTLKQYALRGDNYIYTTGESS